MQLENILAASVDLANSSMKRSHPRRIQLEIADKEAWQSYVNELFKLSSELTEQQFTDSYQVDENKGEDFATLLEKSTLTININPPSLLANSAYSSDRQKQELKLGDRSGVNKAMTRAMDRGMSYIDAQLDLHGYSQAKAHEAVSWFIQYAHSQGWRLLLIITGRGARTPEAEYSSVLRSSLPKWLNSPVIRSLILRFSIAAPQHGGDGAFYILLRS